MKNEILNILESAKDENGCIPMSLVRRAFINCYECEYGIHSGNGSRYICTASPELRVEHDEDFYCGYAERRKNE